MLPGEYFHFVQFPKGPLGKGGNYGSTINSHETCTVYDDLVYYSFCIFNFFCWGLSLLEQKV